MSGKGAIFIPHVRIFGMELPHPRFFAIALSDEYYRVWHVWVTVVCDKDTARAYLSHIRLGPISYCSTAPPG